MSDIKSSIEQLESFIANPKHGLPQEVFLLISRLTPMVNVDLLIQNDLGETLLVWRHDEFYHGWHVAGGIVRFKELFKDRLNAVAKNEFGASIEFDPQPVSIHEKINTSRDTRGHFIAHLYRCRLTSPLSERMRCLDVQNPKHGQWYWHKTCPAQLIPQHEVYRKHIQS